jgi:hypothetical protein
MSKETNDTGVEAKALMKIGDFQRVMMNEFGLYCSIYIANKVIPVSSYRPDMPISSLWLTVVKCAFDLDRIDIVKDTSKRNRDLVSYRQVFCYIAREAGYTYKTIGNVIGKDHSTVIHSYRTISDLIEIKDIEITRLYEKVVQYVKINHNATIIEPSLAEECDDESSGLLILSEEQDQDTRELQAEISSSKITS